MLFFRQNDPQLLKDYAESVQEGERVNTTAYDKAILTLASAALALSLAFIKDLVPVEHARLFWMLVSSWVGFVLSIGVNIGGYLRVSWIAGPRIREAVALLRNQNLTQAVIDQLESITRKDERWIRWLNVCQGVTFLLSMALLTFYVCFNLLVGPRPDAWATWAAKWAAG